MYHSETLNVVNTCANGISLLIFQMDDTHLYPWKWRYLLKVALVSLKFFSKRSPAHGGANWGRVATRDIAQPSYKSR